MKGTTSPVRENVSPVREQCKSPVGELSQSPLREDQFLVTVAPKTGKKQQGENDDHE